jgi:hypothetical protein
MTGCSAIVGSGNAMIYPNAQLPGGIIYGNAKTNIIIDKVKVN